MLFLYCVTSSPISRHVDARSNTAIEDGVKFRATYGYEKIRGVSAC